MLVHVELDEKERKYSLEDKLPFMVTLGDCISGSSGICIYCFFMHFAKLPLMEDLRAWVVMSFEN